MRFTPASSSKASSFSHNASASAPSAPGLHDTLRAGVGPSAFSEAASTDAAAQPASAHPLEARLKDWEATQENLKMEMLRRTYGMQAPIRQGMELKIARDTTWRPAALGGNQPNVHEDILRGKDDTITWEDVYTGEDTRGVPGIHDEMERKLKV
jgi:proteasome maturation protein